MAGGGTSPLTQNLTSQGVAGYAMPAVQNLLGATQAQIFNTDASGNVTGINPYQPYSTNPQDYVAGASPLQQQAYTSASNLGVPSQFNAANLAAMGQLSGYAGLSDPNATQQFMSPYLKNALAPQLAEANRNYDISAANQQAKATQLGAFGGGRQAVLQAENERNRNTALNQIYGTGLQNAFTNAQQQQLAQAAGFGTSGQNLGNLGTSQLAAQQGILGTQNTLGQQQQQNQQNIINAAIKNYETAQQYPYQQLNFLKSSLQGLPIQTQATQGYQAAPSIVSQLAGLGLGGATIYNLLNGGTGKPGSGTTGGNTGGTATGAAGSAIGSLISQAGGLPNYIQQLINKNDPTIASGINTITDPSSPYYTGLSQNVFTNPLSNDTTALDEASQYFNFKNGGLVDLAIYNVTKGVS